jgi:uncharacterized small protein (DUF1192 family)
MSKFAFTGVKKMSEALCEAQSLLREYISPPIAGGSVKGRIYRAARHVGFTFSRTHTLWYGNAHRLDADEMDRLRAAAAKKAAPITSDKSNGQDFWATVTELRSQIAELQSRIEYLDRISRGNG